MEQKNVRRFAKSAKAVILKYSIIRKKYKSWIYNIMDGNFLSIYWAGDLFDAKDLGGNLLLAEAVEKVSQGRYKVMLPQNGECEVVERTSQSIRDEDFKLLLNCDVIVANFDGTDLDSGTVVEYCFAKMVDMPAVLLRTDFRDAGDHTLPDGEPWNLMCSHYPRTKMLHINAMQLYHDVAGGSGSAAGRLQVYYRAIAEEVVNALDNVCKQPAWLQKDELLEHYQRTLKSIGGSIQEKLPESTLTALIEKKKQNSLY